MKNLIIKFISIISILLYKCTVNIKIKESVFIFSKIRVNGSSNTLKVDSSTIKRCDITLDGLNNNLIVNGSIFNTKIIVVGNNNCITINSESKLNNSHIVVRGENCFISIGQSTTFGSVYLVCMGKDNSITIGEGCMFADNIDIWNSDSHPIFIDNKIINPSKSISIGNNVWVGKYCKILKGVNIGANAIIGMNSMVTRNIESGTLNVGVPARCIKTNVNWSRNFIKI